MAKFSDPRPIRWLPATPFRQEIPQAFAITDPADHGHHGLVVANLRSSPSRSFRLISPRSAHSMAKAIVLPVEMVSIPS